MTTQPQRIQLSRRKGWRKPEGAVVVSRPSLWGKPFKIDEPFSFTADGKVFMGIVRNREHAVFLFNAWVKRDSHAGDETRAMIREHLAGSDLACWCPLDQPCHADVLLDIANAA